MPSCAMVFRGSIVMLLVSAGISKEIRPASCAASGVSDVKTPLDVRCPEQTSGDSLLANRVSFRKALSFAKQGDAHRAWRKNHLQLEREVNESSSVLDQFIEEQGKSNDFCSSRLMESKRTLDGLLRDLKELSVEVASHEEILETETENLNITHMSVEAVQTATDEALEQCKKEREEAMKEVAQYERELEELVQIAEPSLRYEHAVKVDGEKTTSEDKLVKNVALSSLGTKEFTRDSCLAFVDFAKRFDFNLKTHMKGKQEPTNSSCDEQREELQEAFTKAYLEVKDLLKEAEDRTTDESCFDAANAKKAAEMVPLVAQRDQSAGRIEYSSAALAATEPVLILVEDRAEKLRVHIKETLTPECKEADEVSEMLQKVRELIVSLSECPGRNDFRLKIPEAEEEEKKEESNEDLGNEETYSSSSSLCQETNYDIKIGDTKMVFQMPASDTDGEEISQDCKEGLTGKVDFKCNGALKRWKATGASCSR